MLSSWVSCVSAPRHGATWSVIPVRPRWAVAWLLCAVVFAALAGESAATAATKKHNHRSSASSAAARKKQSAQAIQNQINVARQVLAMAEAKGGMSAQQVQAAQERIANARSEIEAAGSEEREAREQMREIEQRILAEQGPDTPVGRAQAEVTAAEVAVHRELHRVVGAAPPAADTSPDTHSLSAAERETLRNDAEYTAAKERLVSAKRNLARVRQELLQAHTDWVAASKAAAEAHKRETAAKQAAGRPNLGAVSAKRNLHDAQDVAAAARATIAQGEAMLRQMGMQSSGKQGTSRR